MSDTFGARQFAWAAQIAAGLAASGVRDVVASPGSRSTPLLLAAEEHPDLEVTVIVDERSAAFFALGQARLSGLPSALVCTSGTAAAHYLPAVVEASMSRVPLIVLSADRPGELQHRHAPQTVDQTDLFGSHVRAFIGLGGVDADREPARSAARAVFASRTPEPGPVHVNVALRKPLESSSAPPAAAEVPRTWTHVREPAPLAVSALADALRRAERPLLVAGPAPLDHAALQPVLQTVSDRIGLPCLLESASQLRFGRERGEHQIDLFEPLLRSGSFLESMGPDLIVQLGAPPVSKGLQSLLEAAGSIPVWSVAEYGWNDPHNVVTALIEADAHRLFASLEAKTADAEDGPRAAWCARWRAAERVALEVLETTCAGVWNEAVAIRSLLGALPGGALLMLGNSLPIREADTFCPSRRIDAGVLHQRGAAGIDGLISGAAGAAGRSANPLLLILGDVSFAHDAHGLAALAGADSPIVVAVIDNGGGRLFEHLPVHERIDGAPFERLFLTPTRLDRKQLADAYGVAYARIEDEASLADRARAALSRGQATVLDVRVPADNVALHGDYFGAVEARLVADGLV